MTWLLLGGGAVLALAYAFACLHLADCFTRSKRRRVEGTPGEYGLRYEDVQFRAADRVILRGWYMDSPGARATVLLIHGSETTRADDEHGLLRLQYDYVRRGYNVFSFDLRGRGESSGRRDHLGSQEQRDLVAAVAVVRRRAHDLPLILHGFDLGASLAIAGIASGIVADAVIADTACTSAREALRERWHRWPAPLFASACWVARSLYRADPDALVPLDAIRESSDLPMLLIHGEDDEQLSPAHTLNLAAATLDPRHHLWIVPDVGHCGAYLDNPDLYLRRCLALIEQAVPTRLLASVG